jgi:hypothetical protein
VAEKFQEGKEDRKVNKPTPVFEHIVPNLAEAIKMQVQLS